MLDIYSPAFRRYSDLGDLLRPRGAKTRPVHRLLGRLWISHLCHAHGLSLAQLDQRYLAKTADSKPSGLAYRWWLGETAPTRRSALNLERMLPGSLSVLDSPLRELLDERNLPAPRILRLLGDHLNPHAYTRPWDLPPAPGSLRTRPVYYFDDSEGLAQRGDLLGFTCIMGLVRYAEANNDVDRFLHHAKNAYRMFPVLAGLQWIYPHWHALSTSLDKMAKRCPTMNIWLIPLWDIIESFIGAQQVIISRHDLVYILNDGYQYHASQPILQIPHDLVRHM